MEVRPLSVRLVDMQMSKISPKYEIATGVTDLAKAKGASIAPEGCQRLQLTLAVEISA